MTHCLRAGLASIGVRLIYAKDTMRSVIGRDDPHNNPRNESRQFSLALREMPQWQVLDVGLREQPPNLRNPYQQ